MLVPYVLSCLDCRLVPRCIILCFHAYRHGLLRLSTACVLRDQQSSLRSHKLSRLAQSLRPSLVWCSSTLWSRDSLMEHSCIFTSYGLELTLSNAVISVRKSIHSSRQRLLIFRRVKPQFSPIQSPENLPIILKVIEALASKVTMTDAQKYSPELANKHILVLVAPQGLDTQSLKLPLSTAPISTFPPQKNRRSFPLC